MSKTKIITIALLSILILSAFITIANTNVSAEEDIATYSCSGQVAMAHWEVSPAVTMNAVFAEQLKTDTGKIYQNALCINIVHARSPLSEDIIELDNFIIQDGQIHIEVLMDGFTYNGAASDHPITLNWHITSDSTTTEAGKFYKAEADIVIGGPGRHPTTYMTEANEESWAIVGKADTPTASAFVTKLNGNKNDLTITVTELRSDFTIKKTTEKFSINNNAANTYKVGNYNVYVDTKGNDQIRACYIVK